MVRGVGGFDKGDPVEVEDGSGIVVRVNVEVGVDPP